MISDLLQSLIICLFVLQLECLNQKFLVVIQIIIISHDSIQKYNNMNHFYRDRKIIHHTDSYNSNKVKEYKSYQDYLHQRSKYHNHEKQQSQYHNKKYNNFQDSSNSYKIRQPQLQSETKYYPIQTKIVEYIDRQVKQIVPKKKVITQYRQRKQVQVIPKQVVVTDYYAVQHVRSYIKQVIPQVKIQHIKVPKVVKSQITVPISKQIIYYPNNSQQTLQEKKAKARSYLQKEGVEIQQGAQYRPITQKYNAPHQNTIKNVNSFQKHQPQRYYLKQSPSKTILQPHQQQTHYKKQHQFQIYKQNNIKQQKYILPRRVVHHTLNNEANSQILMAQQDIKSRKIAVEDPPIYKGQNYGGIIKNTYSQYLKTLLSKENISRYKNIHSTSFQKREYPSQTQYKSRLMSKNQRNQDKSAKKYWIK